MPSHETELAKTLDSAVIAFFPGVIGGGLIGNLVEDHLDNNAQLVHDQSSVNTLRADIHYYNKFAHQAKAVGNVSVQHFDIKQAKAERQQIASIKAHEPYHSTGEDVLYQGGGAVLGLIALTLAINQGKSLKRRLERRDAMRSISP